MSVCVHAALVARRVRTGERGQSLTEIALSLPILCVLLMAIVQYGTMIWQDMELNAASRDGARSAVAARVEPNPTAVVRSSAQAALDTIDPSEVDIAITGGWNHGDRVTVAVSKPYQLDIVGFEVWSGRLRSTSTVVIG